MEKSGVESPVLIESLEESKFCKVLSVQSHVVSGFVGNRAAVFILQLLGIDVDFINSVQFSNHTGYPTVKGSKMQSEELGSIYEGLKLNGLDDYDFLLTGYIGSQEFLSNVLNLYQNLKLTRPQLKFICDPVMGDNGQYYIPKDLVPVFKEHIISNAYMITPNQFEAELLSDKKILCHEDAVEVLKTLHKLGPKIVVLTSSELNEFPGQLACYSLQQVDNQNEKGNEVKITRVLVRKLAGSFTGTGDSTCAILLAWLNKCSNNAGLSLVKTITAMQKIIKQSIDIQSVRKRRALSERGVFNASELTLEEMNKLLTKAEMQKFNELCLIQCKSIIENRQEENMVVDDIVVDEFVINL